jgi:hypothetical protein
LLRIAKTEEKLNEKFIKLETMGGKTSEEGWRKTS